MSGGGPTRKREHKLQPGLLEPCALKGARTVLRGRGSGDTSSLPDNYTVKCGVGTGTTGKKKGERIGCAPPSYTPYFLGHCGRCGLTGVGGM